MQQIDIYHCAALKRKLAGGNERMLHGPTLILSS